MLKKTVSYTDFNNESQTDVIYFNLNKAELGKLQMKMNGKFLDHIQLLLEKKQIEGVYNFFYDIVLDSYGERDASGKKFIKSHAMREDFENSIAFSEVLMNVISSPESMSTFIRGILPTGMITEEGNIDAEAIPSEPRYVESGN